MTEEEAKTKWCPHARVGSAESGLGAMNRNAHPDGIIRVGPVLDEARCLGSVCMAWRWMDGEREFRWTGKDEPPPGPEWTKTAEAPSMIDKRFDTQWVRQRPNRGGFCGLAGAPR